MLVNGTTGRNGFHLKLLWDFLFTRCGCMFALLVKKVSTWNQLWHTTNCMWVFYRQTDRKWSHFSMAVGYHLFDKDMGGQCWEETLQIEKKLWERTHSIKTLVANSGQLKKKLWDKTYLLQTWEPPLHRHKPAVSKSSYVRMLVHNIWYP